MERCSPSADGTLVGSGASLSSSASSLGVISGTVSGFVLLDDFLDFFIALVDVDDLFASTFLLLALFFLKNFNFFRNPNPRLTLPVVTGIVSTSCFLLLLFDTPFFFLALSKLESIEVVLPLNLSTTLGTCPSKGASSRLPVSPSSRLSGISFPITVLTNA